VLRDGGNALDACVAACAALGVVAAGQCGLGGDLFAIIGVPGEEPAVLNASGRAGLKGTAEFVRAAGHDRMSGRGPMSVVTPGCAAGWAAGLDRFGTKPLGELLQPAIRLAEDGFAAGAGLASGIEAAMPIYNDAAKATFAGVRAGDTLRQPDLARSLRVIASDGTSVMYAGPLGQAIGEFLEGVGGHHTAADLAAYQPEWVSPAHVPFRGYDVYAPPPNSQALLHLLALSILEPFCHDGRREASEPGFLHLQIEAIGFALATIQRSIADPDFSGAPLGQLLSPELVEHGRAQLGSPAEMAAPAAGDTVYLCAADGEGMVVSMIQSLREGFGSGLMVPGTGIVLNNRGRDFSLADGDPNQIAPGKRPRHTLSPALVMKDGKPFAAYGTRGGDGQPFTMLQLHCNLLAFGMEPQKALEAPRWTVEPAAQGPREGATALEARFPAETAHELAALGHRTQTIRDFDPNCGVASMVQFDAAQGVWLGGADPRGAGSALAL